MKRTFRVVTAGAAVLVFALAAMAWHIARKGSGEIEQWVGSQIQLIADSYLNPKLTFSDLDYEFPATLRLKDLRLTASDPSRANKTVDILAAREATIDLAEVPAVGQALKIERIVLTKPLFQAIAAAPGSARMVGFDDLLKRTPTSSPADHAAPRLSELFQMKRVELVDGRIVYDPRIDKLPAMELDHINTFLDFKPTAEGWYRVATTISRDPVFSIAFAGTINLDNFSAVDLVIDLKAQLGKEQNAYLPPQLQKFLQEHEVRGTLAAHVAGSAPLLAVQHGRLEAQVSLDAANISFGEWRVPIDRMTLMASLENGRLVVPGMQINALGGVITLSSETNVDNRLMTDVQVKATNLMLDRAVREVTAATAPSDERLAGRLNGELHASAPLPAVLLAALPAARASSQGQTLPDEWGQGSIALDHARLVRLPVIHQLGDAITRGRSFLPGQSGHESKPDERAKVTFTLSRDTVRCSELTYIGSMFAARGKGYIGLDQRMNLVVNAGPLEKVQSLMGAQIGGAFGKLTDALASYHVTGTVADPRTEVIVAGAAGAKVCSAIGGGVNRLGAGLDRIGDTLATAFEN